MGKVSTTWAKISSAVFSSTTGTPLSGSTTGEDVVAVPETLLISRLAFDPSSNGVANDDATGTEGGEAGTMVELESSSVRLVSLVLFSMVVEGVCREESGEWRVRRETVVTFENETVGEE